MSSKRPVAEACPAPLDLTGLDLQVRHRVGLAAVGEDQVAILLEGLDALGNLADQHIADPHGVGTLTLKCTLVDHIAAGLGLIVIDEEPVLDVLARVGEVETEHFDTAAGATEVGRHVMTHHVAAEGDRDMLEGGVPTDVAELGWSGARRRRPSPEP